MKHIIALLFFYYGVINAAAAHNQFECSTDTQLSLKDSAELLTRAQQEYAKVKTLSTKFTQTSYLSALDISETSSGVMDYERPGKMRWSYEKPEPQLFLIKDNELTLHQPNENQVIIDSLKEVLISEVPLAFMMGVGDLARDFKIEKGCKNSVGSVLWMSPQAMAATDRTKGEPADERGLKQFALLLSATSSLPRGAHIVDLSGNTTSVLLDEPRTNQSLPEKTFRFIAPVDADLIDRRLAK